MKIAIKESLYHYLQSNIEDVDTLLIKFVSHKVSDTADKNKLHELNKREAYYYLIMQNYIRHYEIDRNVIRKVFELDNVYFNTASIAYAYFNYFYVKINEAEEKIQDLYGLLDIQGNLFEWLDKEIAKDDIDEVIDYVPMPLDYEYTLGLLIRLSKAVWWYRDKSGGKKFYDDIIKELVEVEKERYKGHPFDFQYSILGRFIPSDIYVAYRIKKIHYLIDVYSSLLQNECIFIEGNDRLRECDIVLTPRKIRKLNVKNWGLQGVTL